MALRRLPSAGRAGVVFALALIGLGSWWWLSMQRDTAETAVAPPQPDAYFRELVVVRHDQQGQPEMRVTAEYAEHFENESWIHLRMLEAKSAANEPGWRLTARTGRLSDDGVHLEARGDVMLARSGDGSSEMRLRTESLSVNTDTQLAVTDDHVVISQGTGSVSGRGMRASLDDDYLRLEADVEARYGN
ncbi:MAG TPA: LPS export ABC transporter periplasmic protein LptC [Gammaproteobacteria bacterium]